MYETGKNATTEDCNNLLRIMIAENIKGKRDCKGLFLVPLVKPIFSFRNKNIENKKRIIVFDFNSELKTRVNLMDYRK